MKDTKLAETTEVTEPAKETAAVQNNHKDTIFRMLFSKKENLLSLYNALNRTSYEDVDALEITTLENSIYMNYKNDISFVFDFELMLYEHQSTVNPNMPLRDLIYVTRIVQGMTIDDDLHSSALIKIPAPRFVVFYNGTNRQPEIQTLRLSDAYEKNNEAPDLELKVLVYNVNWGFNAELMEACRILKEYAQFVAQVRIFEKNSKKISEAVENAVDYCIKNNILSDFLQKNRAEAVAVCIFEYDEEKHMKSEREIWKKEGRYEGEEQFASLLRILTEKGQEDDIKRVIVDREYREQLYRENDLDM